MIQQSQVQVANRFIVNYLMFFLSIILIRRQQKYQHESHLVMYIDPVCN